MSTVLESDTHDVAAVGETGARPGRRREGWRDPMAVALFAGGLLVLAGISLVLAWNLVYGPDESTHRTMVEHHAHHLGLLDPGAATWGHMRGHAYHLLSPVPYLPYLPFQWLQEAVGPVDGAAVADAFVTRLGGLVFAAAQLAATALVARGLVHRISLRQAIVVAFAANLIPQLRYIHAYVATDAMTILAGTIAFAVMLHLLAQRHVGLRDAALTGSVLALVALMRYNALPIGGLLFVVFVVQVVRRDGGLADRARAIGLALAIPVLIAGPFHLYVYDELHNGHLLAGPDQAQLTESTYQGRIPPRPDDLVRERVDQLPRTWEGFWQDIVLYAHLPDQAQPLLVGLCLLGLVGLALPASRRRSPMVELRGGDAGTRVVAAPERPGALSAHGRTVAWLAVGAVVLTWVPMAAQWPFNPAGRYLLPAGIPAVTALIAGTGALAGRLPWLRHPVLVAAGGWAMLLLALDLWMLKVVVTTCVPPCA